MPSSPRLLNPRNPLYHAAMQPRPEAVPRQVKDAAERLRRAALAYPDSREDLPWGESAFKVGSGAKPKVFCFMRESASGLSCSFKLPLSAADALDQPFASPTGYGLGKSGWVSSRFEPDEEPPIELLLKWMDESYRAIAPKSALKALDGEGKPAPVKRASKPAGSEERKQETQS